MKICLVGDFNEPRDMGERNLAYHLAKFLEERHSISRMKPKDLLNIQAIRGLWRQRPDVIHYLTGPRAQSFVVLRILKFIGHCRVSLVSAVRPVIMENRLRLAGRIKPDLILAQSLKHIQVFERNGFKAVFFPNGVDANKFRPVNRQQKNNLRRKHNVLLDKFVVLHTGYIARRRGVGIFARLAREPEICVVLVSATSWINPDPELLAELKEAGCKLIIREMYLSPAKEAALIAYRRFLSEFSAKYPQARDCLCKDEDILFTFYDFPAEHWLHIRTTNPIESTFAMVRHRQRQTKGCGLRFAMLMMVLKLAKEAEHHWRSGSQLLAKVVEGIRFIDGVIEKAA